MKIKEHIVKILSNAEVEENRLYIKDKLDRKDYLDTNSVLESIGGKWNKKLKCHLFEQDPEDVLSEVINTGEFECLKEKKNTLNYFPTPQNLAKRLVDLAEIQSVDFCFEPSAGQGAILDELIKKTSNFTYVEIDPTNFAVCQNKYKQVGYCVDFLTLEDSPRFDKIAANPPFSVPGHSQIDICFIYKCFKNLRKDGILVSIVSESPFFRTNKKSVVFREWLKDNNAEIFDLPSGAFKESGTMVKTRIIKVIKN